MIEDSEMALEYRTRKFTVDEYHAMAEAGILGPEERVELIEGEIVEMAPVGSQHHGRHARLTKLLILRLGDRAQVSSRGSIRLSNVTEPEPDVMILRPREDFYEGKFCEPDDAIALIEISYSSLSYDRRRKAGLYGRAGVREYWIVNLVDDQLEIHREPNDLGYTKRFVAKRDEQVAFEALPGAVFTADEFLALL